MPRTSRERVENLSEEARAAQAGSARDKVEAAQSVPKSSLSKKTLSIQTLYLNCLEALRAVTIMSTDKERPNMIYSRLVVWGCGLFRASTSLDLILEKDKVESVTTFKEHIIGVLADITILLGMVLKIGLSTQQLTPQRHHFEILQSYHRSGGAKVSSQITSKFRLLQGVQ